MDQAVTLRIRDPLWPRIGIGAIAACLIGIGVHASWTVAEAEIEPSKRLLYLAVSLGGVGYCLWFAWLMWWSDLNRDWRLRLDTTGLIVDAPDLFHAPVVIAWSDIRGFLVDVPGAPGKPVRALSAASAHGKHLAALPIGPVGNLLVVLTRPVRLENARLPTRLHCGPEVRSVLGDMEDPRGCARALSERGVAQLENVELREVKRTKAEGRRTWPALLLIVPAWAGLFGIARILGELD